MRKYPKRAYAHTRYESCSGEWLPGVTTIVQLLAKPQLYIWSNKKGLEGIDSEKLKDALANIGTCAHTLIEYDLMNKEPDLSDYTPDEIKRAQIPFKKFKEWQKNRNFSAEKVELELVSERHKFGGTCDLYGTLDGKKTLIDIKTSKSCYLEHKLQVAAYRELLEENGYKVEQVKILRVGREGKEGFDELEVTRLETLFSIFLCLLKVYQLKRELE